MYTRIFSATREFFRKFTPRSGFAQVGNKSTTESCCVGTLPVETIVNFKKHRVVLKCVLYAPGMMLNLVSISKVVRNEVQVRVDKDPFRWGIIEILHKQAVFVHMVGVKTKKCLYQAQMSARMEEEALLSIKSIECKWYSWLGHCSDEM